MSSLAVNPTNALVVGHGSSLRARIESALGERLSSTLLLRERAAPVTVPTGIAALDNLTGGLPRGALSEIAGPASSGRTGVMLAALAGATRRQEVCALVDASDSFDPASAAATGVDLKRLLWVRCNSAIQRNRGGVKSVGFAFGGALEQVLKVTDLLLQSGGFGMVVLDLGDVPVESARRVPLTSWFRFRRAVEPTATVLLLIEQQPCAKTCASLVLCLQPEAVFASNSTTFFEPTQLGPGSLSHNVGYSFPNDIHIPKNNAVGHAALLRGMRSHAEVVRSWAQRKPPQSSGADFELRTGGRARL
jgi:recombination protein RecA